MVITETNYFRNHVRKGAYNRPERITKKLDSTLANTEDTEACGKLITVRFKLPMLMHCTI